MISELTTAETDTAKEAMPKQFAKGAWPKKSAKEAAPKNSAKKAVSKESSNETAREAMPKESAKKATPEEFAKETAPKEAAKEAVLKESAEEAAPKKSAQKETAMKAAPKDPTKNACPNVVMLTTTPCPQDGCIWKILPEAQGFLEMHTVFCPFNSVRAQRQQEKEVVSHRRQLKLSKAKKKANKEIQRLGKPQQTAEQKLAQQQPVRQMLVLEVMLERRDMSHRMQIEDERGQGTQ